jgi:methanesulfonate monooxygenase small subunit
MTTDRAAIEELIYSSCMALDDNDYASYMSMCSPDFTYRLTAFSPEVKQDMSWLDHDRAELEDLFATLPKHNSDRNPLTRNAVVYKVKINEEQKKADVISALQIFRTALNGGKSELFAVGKYVDEIALDGDEPRLVSRRVKLDTRDLGWGYHVPF